MVTQPALEFNPVARRIHVSGKEVFLTNREYQFFEIFYQNPGVALSFEQLEEAIFGRSISKEYTRVWIHRLRCKFGPEFRITNIPGWGYRYDA